MSSWRLPPSTDSEYITYLHDCVLTATIPLLSFLLPADSQRGLSAVQADGKGGGLQSCAGGVQPNPSLQASPLLAICLEANVGAICPEENHQRSSKLKSMTLARASLSSHSASTRLSS